ncbi:MAG: zinc ribbon domain-containing protein [Desulfobacteraceae bacterium]|nr:zinc ribbon domain-containing protein [Desulfobacteraceae bacterium]
MPLYDFECPSGHITEVFAHHKQKKVKCSTCGKKARRIITASGPSLVNENPAWLKSVVEVADKSNPARHVQEFVKNPTRETYRNWMKGEGIRPLDHTEHGGPPLAHKPPEVDMSRVRTEVLQKARERRLIEVRS